jgi:DNA invertase Pin-like site-specific DNA recombinase
LRASLVRLRWGLGFVEHESGRKGADKRKQFAALFEDAAKRKFDCVLFWALDRFSREGMAQTIGHLQRLTSYGVTFHSYTEPHLVPNFTEGRVKEVARILESSESLIDDLWRLAV